MGVAQLVELLVVVQAVAGSSPVAHPSGTALASGALASPPIGPAPDGAHSGRDQLDKRRVYAEMLPRIPDIEEAA